MRKFYIIVNIFQNQQEVEAKEVVIDERILSQEEISSGAYVSASIIDNLLVNYIQIFNKNNLNFLDTF